MVLATHEATAYAMQTAEAGSTIDVTANRDGANRLVVDVQSEGPWVTIAHADGAALAVLVELTSGVTTRTSHTLRMRQDT